MTVMKSGVSETFERCDYCGRMFGELRAWDWPPDNPTRIIWLHGRCEALWYDSNGLPEGCETFVKDPHLPGQRF